MQPLLDDKPRWKMPIESYSSEEPVSDLNGSPNSIEALRAPEIKLILRAFSVDPVLILDAKTKMDLVELARHHGITSMPDEWTLQKLKSKECGLEEALSQQQHYDGIEHNKSAGFKQPAPIEEDEDDEESLVVSTGRGRAQAKKKKKTPKKKVRSPKSASQAEGAKAPRSAERKTAQQGLEASPESFHSTETDEISLGGGGGSCGGCSGGGGSAAAANGSGGVGRPIDGGTKRTDGGGTKRNDGGTKRNTKAAMDTKEKEYLILAAAPAAAPTSTAASLSAALAPAVVAAAAPAVMAAAAAHLGSVLTAAPTSTAASLSAALAPAVVATAAPAVMAAAAAHVGSKYGGGIGGGGGSLAVSGGIDLWLCQMDDINYEEREDEPSFEKLPHVVRRGQHLKSNRDSLAKSMREYGLSLDDLKAVLNQAAKASQHEAEVAEALASDERNVVVSAMNTLGLSVDEIRKVLVDVRR